MWLIIAFSTDFATFDSELKGPWDAAVPKIDGKVASMGMGNNAP